MVDAIILTKERSKLMKRRNGNFNTKRQICGESNIPACAALAERARYGGNPEHKKNPGDFGLTPPSGPRAGKSLCDGVEIFSRKLALHYLKQGMRLGLVSERKKGEWPQNVWSVTDDGIPLEAQLENSETGSYHGYPMPLSDPLAEEVITQWKQRNGKY